MPAQAQPHRPPSTACGPHGRTAVDAIAGDRRRNPLRGAPDRLARRARAQGTGGGAEAPGLARVPVPRRRGAPRASVHVRPHAPSFARPRVPACLPDRVCMSGWVDAHVRACMWVRAALCVFERARACACARAHSFSHSPLEPCAYARARVQPIRAQPGVARRSCNPPLSPPSPPGVRGRAWAGPRALRA
jgi:hypothetical protein